jgi:hypothetical protein
VIDVDHGRALERDLDVFDAAAVALMQRLLGIPATAGWAVASSLAMMAAIADVREKVGALRQYRRDQLAAESRKRR